MRSEEQNNTEEESVEPSPPTGQDELLYSIGDALRHRPTKDAFAKLVQAFAEDIPRRASMRKHSLWHSTALIIFTLILIAVLGWQKVISGEATTALIGGLVGYVFGRQSRT